MSKTSLPVKIVKIIFLLAFAPPLIEGYKTFFSETIPTILKSIKKLLGMM